MRKLPDRFKNILIPAGGALAVCLILLLFLPRAGAAGHSDSQAVTEGVNYLRALESEDPETVENILKEYRQAEIDARREEMIGEILEGDVDVWSLFEDYAILGDSRAVGFYYYDFLPHERVLAGGGETIRNIEDHMEDLQALNPSSIFLCFGLNDTSIGYWDTPEEYAEEYLETLEWMHEELPDTTVYVSSILPAHDPAFERSSKWYNIPDFSAAVGEMCEENGIPFVDNDEIADEYYDLWDPDGIHLRKSFYQYWGANLMISFYEHQGVFDPEAEA